MTALGGLNLLRDRQASCDPVASLLSHTLRTVPYYESFGLQGEHVDSLLELPLVERNMVSAHPEWFCSSAIGEDRLRFRTSGTTGVPLNIYRDRASYYDFAYEIYAVLFQHIPGLCERLVPARQAAVLVHDNPQRTVFSQINPSIGYAIVNRFVLNRSMIEDERLVSQLEEEMPPLLYGRPQGLLNLAQLSKGLRSGATARSAPAAVLCSGDELTENVRGSLESWFEAPCYNGYGSQETGLIAVECGFRQMHIFTNRAVVEVRSEEDGTVAREGEGELIVTGLENWGMPFLRYRTGDLGRVRHQECGCGKTGPVIDRLQGRRSVEFTFLGRKQSAAVLNAVFDPLPIAQFRVLQKRDLSLQVEWVPSCGVSEPEAVEVRIVNSLRLHVGPVPIAITQERTIGKSGEKIQKYTLESV